ncbi:TetR/AcrR family transcriptional regulator [Mycobacterium sp. NPDC003323]
MALRPNDFRPQVAGIDTYHQAALPEDRLTTERQRQRRSRILDAAVEVAGAGGYDRVHVRSIALRANVSLATLYFYFPSKVHVLVWALERELVRFDDYLCDAHSPTADPVARLHEVVSQLIDLMAESARVTEALTHAYVASTVVASAEAEMIRRQTKEMFVRLMGNGAASDFRGDAADILTDVWTSEILALVQGRRTIPAMRHRFATVIDLIFRAQRARFSEGTPGEFGGPRR